MTGEHITTGLVDKILREKPSNEVFPNIHLGNFECDVLEITKAGYAYEYEVKISKADFKADCHKAFHGKTKHSSLKEGLHVNYFYYVVPEGLISVDDIPEFAGLIYARDGQFGGRRNGYSYSVDRMFFNTVKSAPKLSATKVTEKRMMKLYQSTYYRFHQNRKDVSKLRKDISKLREELHGTRNQQERTEG